MIDPMDEGYWKRKVEESIKKLGKDKLLTGYQVKDLIKKLRRQ